MKHILSLIIICLVPLAVFAQNPRWEKMSPWVRSIMREQVAHSGSRVASGEKRLADNRELCAFVRTSDADGEVLKSYGCRQLARVGSISIAMIPLNSLSQLSLDLNVLRIEARQSAQALNDTTRSIVGVSPVWEGRNLPQVFTGKGVVVGVMDIGFDLTHPNFFDRKAENYRIRQLWDMLSLDTIGSQFPVGRDYKGTAELLSLAHSRDGLTQTHGTHTLGSAAGSGFKTPYSGMAPESDICLVANATGNNVALIDSADIYKYTFATDALGFKYIFDYAKSVGKPCVASFSEGGGEDFWGYDQLYYEMLDSLVGPGRIIVSSAGNQGRVKTWFHKPREQQSMGTFVFCGKNQAVLTVKSTENFDMRWIVYGDTLHTLTVNTADVLSTQDSLLEIPFAACGDDYLMSVQAYPSCYDSIETCYDVTLEVMDAKRSFGTGIPSSFEVVGEGADVNCWRVTALFGGNSHNPLLDAAEATHNVYSPSTAPAVISVGATMWREGVYNEKGQWMEYEHGGDGMRVTFSSVGPTTDGRIKPDVMAPGTNIISSYGSYYADANPYAPNISWIVGRSSFGGRLYPWASDSGTSMSAPVVAGIVALWLQACPTLTPQAALEAMAATSRHLDDTMEYPNNLYGYGEINAYRGLLYLLGLDDVKEIAKTTTKATVAWRDGEIVVDFGGVLTSGARLSLYSVGGKCIQKTVIPAGCSSYNIRTGSLAAGFYAVQIDGRNNDVSGSALIAVGR